MKIVEGVRYYTKNEVAQLVGRSSQMIHLWDKWSDEREKEGNERFIPKPTRMGEGATYDYRFWSEADVEKIKIFADSIKKGNLAEYSKRQWGKRGINV